MVPSLRANIALDLSQERDHEAVPDPRVQKIDGAQKEITRMAAVSSRRHNHDLWTMANTQRLNVCWQAINS